MGSEMCIRDSLLAVLEDDDQALPVRAEPQGAGGAHRSIALLCSCLLYTSDAADERSSVDLGGRRIIKKKHTCDDKV